MSLFLFLIVVVSLACGSIAPRQLPWSGGLTASVALISLWGLIAKAAAGFALARVRGGVPPGVALQRLQRQLDVLRWLGIAAVLVCLLGFNLAGAAQSWPLFSQSMSLQGIVLLTPGLLLIACTLWAEHQYRVAMGYTAAGLLAAVGQTTGSLLRLAGWMIAPILAMLAVADLLAWLPWADRIPTGVGLIVLTLLIVPALVPWMAKRVWPTRRLDAAEHRWIRELVDSAGLARLDVRLWNTGMRSSNAVIVGFFPRLRSLLLTDRLIRDLPAERLKLIVLHEVAHIRRGHIWLRMFSVLPGWILAAGILHIYGTAPAWLLLSNATAIAVTLVMLRLVAHETEFDADRTACQLAMQIDPLGDRSAARRCEDLPGSSQPTGDSGAAARGVAAVLSDALRRVNCSEGGSQRASWLHPSIDSRCAHLQHWADAVQHATACCGHHRASTPFSIASIPPILCGSEPATPAAGPPTLEKIDESNRCDYVQR